jgi:hypothetical protein
LLALAIVITLLALLLLMPVGADVGYDGEFCLRLKVGVVSLTLFPGKKKKEKGGKKKGKSDKAKSGKEKKAKPKPDKDFIIALIKMALRALGKLRRHISVDLLELKLVCGGSDPYSTAMSYGYATAAVGALYPMLERGLNIRDRDIDIDIDFDAGKPSFSARLILTIQVWEIIYIAIAFLSDFIKYKTKKRREALKTERTEINGKPDKRAYERDHDEDEGYGGRKHHSRRADNVA